MFSLIWKKYLPVIIILLKKVKQEEQSLPMNVSDFERASGGKKVKFSFNSLEINNGKLNTQIKCPEIAKDLAQVLLQTPKSIELLADLKLNFSLTNDCVLTFKTLEVEEEVEEEVNETEEETTAEEVAEKQTVD